jgi:non-ribosomal peptide synthetase component F
LHNLYGPTETAIEVTSWSCPVDFEGGTVPIGRPISNVRLYVLDAYGELVSQGAVGELCIGGAAVGRGYSHRPEQTAERFVADAYALEPGARMYRTGDLVRHLADGNLEFLGRADQQVKVRGFRIELGEIEARLREHAWVRDAVVVAREDAPGDTRLVAYVTSADGADESELVATLRGFLGERLPEYMVPSAIVRLASLPLTPSGKLDRRALPAPGADAVAARSYEAPRGELEATLARHWSELLGVERVGRQDHFFELGGHSLLAVRLLSRAREASGTELPLATLFSAPVLWEQAVAIANLQRERVRQDMPSMARVSRENPLALSFAQQRLWFLAELGAGTSYHMPLGLRLFGPLDVSAWRRSLDVLVSRHEALRSVFVSVDDDGEPHVELLPAASGFSLVEEDLQGSADARSRVEALQEEEAEAPFDLSRGPLIRGRLLRLGPEEHVFLLTQHHIVSDGWSMGVLMRELGALYRAFVAGEEDPLPPLEIQYPDYAAWQRAWLSGERLEAQARYWRENLAGAPAQLELPTDRPRPREQSFAGGVVEVRLDAELTRALKRMSQELGTTLFMTVLAAWAAVLGRLSGQREVVIGTPSANRGRREIEGLIGFFVNTLPLRIDLSGEPSLGELLGRVRQTTLGAQESQELPFEQVVEIVSPPRRLDQTPVFQVMFAWQNEDEGRLSLPSLRVELANPRFETAKFDLEVALGEVDGAIVGVLSYATALFEASTAERYAGYLEATLRALAADAGQPAMRVAMLGAAEREQLLETFNRTAPSYPRELCVHALFEEQARRTPDAVAVVEGDVAISYDALNRHANRLAWRLIAKGVRPGDRVATLLPRGVSLVIAELGILKAGGAYVPLDPEAPSARNRGW